MPKQARKRRRLDTSVVRKRATLLIAKSSSNRCPFLDVPLEIRSAIYTLLFQEPDTFSSTCYLRCQEPCEHFPIFVAPMLLTCRQIHSEAWPIYAEHRTFAFGEPFDFANGFLSFLPQQRLRSLRHLTLFHEEWITPTFLQRFERIWWQYLDLFTSLDTLTLASGNYEYSDEFHKLIPTIIGLLEFGATDKPKWINKKTFERGVKVPSGLTGSFDWSLQLAAMADESFVAGLRPAVWKCRIVVRKGHDLLEHSQIFERWTSLLPYERRARLSPWHYDVGARNGCTRVMSGSGWLGYDFDFDLKLGPHTKVIHDPGSLIRDGGNGGGDVYQVETVGITGRWINSA